VWNDPAGGGLAVDTAAGLQADMEPVEVAEIVVRAPSLAWLVLVRSFLTGAGRFQESSEGFPSPGNPDQTSW
jgi:hypothetical protein